MIGAIAHELRLMAVALQYFTRLPVPALRRFDERWLSQSVRYFPLAGLVVGLLSALALFAAAHLLPWPVATAVALAASVAITGAFHEDGLADTFDALGGHVPRERALAIMRDSRIGTFGACALAFALLLRWQILVALPPVAALVYLAAAHPAARAAAAALMAGLPYVRLEDDAKAKPVARPMGTGQLLATLFVGAAPVVALVLLRPEAARPLALAMGLLVPLHLACRWWFRRRLGGYTGDALGCAEQLSEIAFGLAMLAVLHSEF